MFLEESVSKRIAELRTKKGVSARDMSLSIGQGPGYINNIENGHNLPSMTVFFYICDYFGITPKEFFDVDSPDPAKLNELFEKMRTLDSQQLDAIMTLVDQLKK